MSALRKVLVVDDDPVVGKSFDRVLSGKGYAVITASNGQEALNKLDAEDYDVVFTDIKMPGMNGLEVAERVKQKRPWLPVVIVTGYGSKENETRAEAAGVSSFLRKPLSPEMIEGSAEKALLERDAGVAVPGQVEAAPQPAPTQAPPASFGRVLKNVALFFAAPFVGLAYILAFPFVGIGMLAWIGGKALMKYASGRAVATFMAKTGMFIGGPLLGLAFVLLMPWVGAVILAWIGGRALLKRYDAD
ncbi:MAG: response regulator [Betaproteobacteria bacterium]|nr:response regulator [Betaproteobacteria bacterium]